MFKQFIIPVAAFAVTTTSVFAFGNGNFNNIDWSNTNANLTTEQISTLEEVSEIRQNTEERVQAMLEAVGLDRETMRGIHNNLRVNMEANHNAVQTALDNNDYEAFMEAIANTPLADNIESEADFNKFQEAHELRQNGDLEEAQALFSELGIERPMMGGHPKNNFGDRDGLGTRQNRNQ